jgi:hypothetical protein
MHVHTVRTKYTFGDRVKYASHFNGSGTGTICGIEFDPTGRISYFIEVDGSPYVQGGIEDDDITLLTDESDITTPFPHSAEPPPA